MTIIIHGKVRSYATKKPEPQKFKPLKSALFQRPMRPGAEDFKQCERVGNGIGVATIKADPLYQDPELQHRERQAKEVKHTIAPISNKGAYQLITNTEDFKTMGRKV